MSLAYTPVEEIPKFVTDLTATFKSGKTQPIQYRLNQLRNLYFALQDNADLFIDALEKDFHRTPFETKFFEYYVVKEEIISTMKNLSKWLKPQKPYAVPLVYQSASIRMEKIPLGVVLIIVPFNYPLMLGVSPLVGAIAAGNCVVYKPSELLPHFSSVLSKVLTEALDKDTFRVANGGVSETGALLKQNFDLIFFTGSTKVGKIVAKAAAENLTPTVLELGGKSPAIVTKNHGNLDTLAARLIWGRLLNAGQTCVAVDYILVDEDVKPALIAKLKEKLNELYPKLTKDSDFTHIVSDASFNGLVNLLETTDGDILTGGLSEIDAESKFFPPTLIDNVTWDDATMQREIFGPILPIITYKDLPSTLEFISANEHLDCPLALYIYSSNKKEIDLIRSKVRSGAIGINDNITHVAVSTIPFGGIGNSGYGHYHGKYSIDTFTHERVLFNQPIYAEFLLKLRYPPFTKLQQTIFSQASDVSAYFKRTGDVPIHPKGLFHYLKVIAVLIGLASVVLRYL